MTQLVRDDEMGVTHPAQTAEDMKPADDTKPAQPTQGGCPLTAEEIVQLVALKKRKNTSWKDIAREMGKPESLLRPVAKELQGLWDADGNDVAEGKRPKPKQAKQDQKDANKPSGGEENAKDRGGKDESKKKGDDKDHIKRRDDKHKRDDRWPRCFPYPRPEADYFFTDNDISLLAQLIMKENAADWVRVAQGFQTMTGRAVNPWDIRQKFTGY